MSTKYTPTVILEQGTKWPFGIVLRFDNGYCLSEDLIECSTADKTTDEANRYEHNRKQREHLEHIVRCVNSHEQLVAAVRDAESLIRDGRYLAASELLRAALAAADPTTLLTGSH